MISGAVHDLSSPTDVSFTALCLSYPKISLNGSGKQTLSNGATCKVVHLHGNGEILQVVEELEEGPELLKSDSLNGDSKTTNWLTTKKKKVQIQVMGLIPLHPKPPCPGMRSPLKPPQQGSLLLQLTRPLLLITHSDK